MKDSYKKLKSIVEWTRDDGSMSRFLHDAMKLIEENITFDQNEEVTIDTDLYQKLLNNLKEKNIFKGQVITFMAPVKSGDENRLIVAASTKETTDEGLPMRGLTCGNIASEVFESNEINLKVIENKTQKPKKSKYTGKSYLYPIVDIDKPTGIHEKFGVIAVANLNAKFLPKDYITLLINMGEALGRQIGRVVERAKAQAELKQRNLLLKNRAQELESSINDIKNLIKVRDQQIALQDFLFGTISHDFKNNIISIMVQVEDILKNIDPKISAEHKRVINYIKDSLETIKIVDDLRTLQSEEIPIRSYLEKYKMENEHVLLLRDKGKKIYLTWFLNADISVCMDSIHLKRVLDNIILNAIKYSPNGGEIHMESSVVKDADSDFLELSVSDEGVGINEEDLEENIFKSRWRSSSAKRSDIEGTGVGLSYVKYIINKSGGMIKVKSRPGITDQKGKLFVTSCIIRIPRFKSEFTEDCSSCKPRREKRVLVIGEKDSDGNFLNREMQFLVEDIETWLGEKIFLTEPDLRNEVKNLSDYGIVAAIGTPEMNRELFVEADKCDTHVICLDSDNEKVFIHTKNREEWIPSASFLIAIPNILTNGSK